MTRESTRFPPQSLNGHLGVLLAGEHHTHRFVVTNDSERTWNVTGLVSTCSCTVAEAPTERVVPGDELSVSVDYHAPPETAEDFRTVFVDLEDEAGAQHRLALHVRATIREPMTVAPTPLQLNLSVDEIASTNFEVQNWSEEEWTSFQVKPSVDWIEAAVEPVRPRLVADDRAPRQIWRVALSADPEARGRGNLAQAMLTLSAAGDGTVPSRFVPIELVGGERVRAVPSLLLLREATSDSMAEGKVVLRYSEPVTAFSPDNLEIRHDLDAMLDFAWRKVSPRAWELTVRSAVLPSTSRLKGVVSVTFPDAAIPDLKIPAYLSLSEGHDTASR